MIFIPTRQEYKLTECAMKKNRKFSLSTLLTGILLLAYPVFANAQQSALLWKISGNGLEKPSYIYGTIHLICPEDFLLTETIKSKFEETEQLVTEIDMDDPQMMMTAQRLSVNPGMANITADMKEEDIALLNKFFSEHYGSDLSSFGVLKPFALLSMMLPKMVNCDQPVAFEQEFLKLAAGQKKENLGLETIEDQIGTFESVDKEEQIQWLVDFAKNPQEMEANFKKMVEAYRSRDLEKLIEVMRESPEFEEIEEEFLYVRNEAWISKIEKFAKDKSTFFAVGAAHLPLDRGVINLLEKQGYTLTPIE